MYDYVEKTYNASSPLFPLPEKLRVDTHIPVLPLVDAPQEPSQRKLSNVVIQGLLESARRNYQKILLDLAKALKGSLGLIIFSWTLLIPKP